MILSDLNRAFKQEAWVIQPDPDEEGHVYSSTVRETLALYYKAEDQEYLKDFRLSHTGVMRRGSQQYAVFQMGPNIGTNMVPLTAGDLRNITTGITELLNPEKYTLSEAGKSFLSRLTDQIEIAHRSLIANEKHVRAQAYNPGISNLGQRA